MGRCKNVACACDGSCRTESSPEIAKPITREKIYDDIESLERGEAIFALKSLYFAGHIQDYLMAATLDLAKTIVKNYNNQPR